MSNGYFNLTQRLSPPGYAREVLHALGIDSFPVDAKEVARQRGITCRESDFRGVQGFDGALYRSEGKAVMIINRSIPYPERQNFTVAHELGHFEIKGHNEKEYHCSGRSIEAFNAERAQETEANQFAAELLMPEQLIRDRMKRNPFNLETVQGISRDFGTSLTAATLRAVEFSEDPCAMVVSIDGRIKWTRKSVAFRYELRSGPISDDTYAVDFFKGSAVPEGPKPVGPLGWLAGRGIPHDLYLIEHSIYFSNLNIVLSLLSLSETEEAESEDY